MGMALREAEEAYAEEEVPVGAIIVDRKGEVIARARNLTSNGFEAALFEQELSNATGHYTETVGYLAVYSPSGSGTVNYNGASTAYSVQGMSLAQWSPVPDGTINQIWKTVPGSTTQLNLGEEQSKDLETSHTAETVHVLGIAGLTHGQQVTSNGIDPTALRQR